MQSAAKQEVILNTTPGPDPFTIASIGILAYMLGNVLHEGAGHGGACILVGARPLVLSSVHFECSAESRLVMAGGLWLGQKGFSSVTEVLDSLTHSKPDSQTSNIGIVCCSA